LIQNQRFLKDTNRACSQQSQRAENYELSSGQDTQFPALVPTYILGPFPQIFRTDGRRFPMYVCCAYCDNHAIKNVQWLLQYWIFYFKW